MTNWQICPRCGQGAMIDAQVVATGERIKTCTDCDATWPWPITPAASTFVDLQDYLEERGIPFAGDPYRELPDPPHARHE